MKYLKKTILFALTISILCIKFYSLYIPVCASDHGGGGGADHGKLTEEEKSVKKLEILDNIEKYLLFLCSEIGVFFNGNSYSDFYDNYVDYVTSTNDKWFENNVSVSDDGNAVFSQTLMSSLKAYIDKYLKTEQTKEENGGFYLLPTTKFIDAPANSFQNSFQYQTFRNIVLEKGVLAVRTKYFNLDMTFFDPFSDPEHPMVLVGNITDLNRLENNPTFLVNAKTFCMNHWERHNYRVQTFSENNKVYSSCNDSIDFEYSLDSELYQNEAWINFHYDNHGSYSIENYIYFSSTGEYLRVYVSETAAKNYSVGNRKVFVTQNFYDYEPEDLTVSIDDLQKSVSDLQKIIDELLKRVTDNTSEKEIMELLRLILEELRNQQGTGSGGGTGDVTVSVDLKETNNWLYKIYNKVSEIYAKMNNALEDAGNTAIDKIQESLDEIIKQLKAIKGWTIAGTIIDGVDAVADWLDFISDMLTDADSGVATISSTMDDAANLLKTKFPFCIPWDVYFLVSFLAHEPKTPVFSLPIKLERLGIEEYIEVDMSQFKVVSDISRTLLTLIYCYALLNLTMKIFPMTKEET